jgi:hypothetical protein
MRILVTLLLTAGLVLYGGYSFLRSYPEKLYQKWISGEGYNKYYGLEKYDSLWLDPTGIEKVEKYTEDYAQLWKPFSLGDVKVPLPVRHPMFQTVPLFEMYAKAKAPQVGIAILDPSGREISRIYTMPKAFMEDHSQGQELFRLPYVRNKFLKIPEKQFWIDLFTHGIEAKPKSLHAMIYDLYLLHFRSKLFPKGTLRYGLLKEDKALLELKSQNKDYIMELVITNANGTLLSYMIRTEKNNPESRRLRSKFLGSIEFHKRDVSMGKILYKEFKLLNFARQVDQEGMLYLFSAWTQDMTNNELLKEIIFYLERGNKQAPQLTALYKYSLKRFGKTFTRSDSFSANEDPNIVLQRKIELEEQAKRNTLKATDEGTKEDDLPPEEKMNLYLKKAKESATVKDKDMVIH